MKKQTKVVNEDREQQTEHPEDLFREDIKIWADKMKIESSQDEW